MSRLVDKVLDIPASVSVEISGGNLLVKDSKGSQVASLAIPDIVSCDVNDKVLSVSPNTAGDVLVRDVKRLMGLFCALAKNFILGAAEKWSKFINIVGVGYKASFDSGILTLSLGYSHDIKYMIPEGIDIELEGNNRIKFSSSDRCFLGTIVADVAALRKYNPYKRKGCFIEGKYYRFKEVNKK